MQRSLPHDYCVVASSPNMRGECHPRHLRKVASLAPVAGSTKYIPCSGPMSISSSSFSLCALGSSRAPAVSPYSRKPPLKMWEVPSWTGMGNVVWMAMCALFTLLTSRDELFYLSVCVCALAHCASARHLPAPARPAACGFGLTAHTQLAAPAMVLALQPLPFPSRLTARPPLCRTTLNDAAAVWSTCQGPRD